MARPALHGSRRVRVLRESWRPRRTSALQRPPGRNTRPQQCLCTRCYSVKYISTRLCDRRASPGRLKKGAFDETLPQGRGRFRGRNPTETGLFCCLTKLCIIPPSMAVKKKTVQRSLDLTGNAEGSMTKYWAFARGAHGATRNRPAAPTSASNAAWTPVAETTQPSPCRLSQQSS